MPGSGRAGDGRSIEELIEASSLGTPEAKALRERTPREVVDRIMERVAEQPFAMPDRIAIDAKGYGWRVWDDEDGWSMVPTNPDNSPIPTPITYFINESDVTELAERVRSLTMAIDRALHELGVPNDGYPAPVANAVRILDDTRKNPGA